MKTNPRYLAVLAVQKFEESGDFLAEILDSFIQNADLKTVDRSLFTELVYGTVRMKLNLDYVIQKFSSRPLHKIDPKILQLLRISVYQILYLDRIPDSAAVNEAVKIASRISHQGTKGFVNGLLRSVSRGKEKLSYPDPEKDPTNYLAYRYSFPQWMVKMWLTEWGFAHAEKLCAAFNGSPAVSLRVNTLKTTFEALRDHFAGKGAVVQGGRFAPDVMVVQPGYLAIEDPLLDQGAYYIQDEGSALIAHALEPQPGELIYDLCSAPGGKTTHIAQLMEDQGQIVAFDVSPDRLAKVDENKFRLGISIIQTRVANSAEPMAMKPAHGVLVDAPCSGLGTMGHRPDIRWRKSLDDITDLAALQRQIMTTAAGLVRPGGRLVYSTCTITKAEGMDIANWFLSSFPDFRPAHLPSWFPQPAFGEPEHMRQILPHIHGVDGFFVAVFSHICSNKG